MPWNLIQRRGSTMTKQYDFRKARRGAAIEKPSKTRITIMLDNDVIEYFRTMAEADGVGYQTKINAVLKEHMQNSNNADQSPITVGTLRQILREELGTV